MEPGGEREQQQRELRRQAAEYYQRHEVPQRLEEALNATYPLRPADLYGHLANYFSKYSKPPVICKLVGKKVLDGVGRPTLEVEVFCTVKNNEKRICSTVIPSHADIFENALPEASDADEKERNDSIKTALEWVNESVNAILKDMQPTDQCKIDKLLGEYFTKKVEEEEERKKTEKQEQETEISIPTCVSSSPAAVQAGKKKGIQNRF